MPYLILSIGILIGLFGLYKFFLSANSKQIIALFFVAFLVTICIALFYLAVTGRLAAAIGLLTVTIPLVISMYKQSKNKQASSHNSETPNPNHQDSPWWENINQSHSGDMSKKEAFEILGLSESASEEEINNAYKKLIKKVHPDQEGSAWMAAKLNQARITLTNKK
jgi:Ca2+/Na+ antiporter